MPIFNVFTRKFSEFVGQPVDDVVGLTGGANSIGPNSGGGGASITYTFTQAAAVVPPLYLGAAVRVDVASGLWECCLGTTALDAEFYAFIVGIVGNVYTVQFAGVVPDGTPFLTGLIPGTPYYLSDTVPGGISAVPPAITGEVNLPVLWAMDNGNSVIKMSRGFIEGSGGGGGGGGGSPNNVATVTQANAFALGDVLYLQTDQIFAKSHARTLAAAQAEWVVTSIVTPGTVFTIQQGGRIQGLILTDDVGAAIVSGPIYYVSPIVGQEGKLTQVNPIGVGFYSKPFYVQQVLASNTGWLLDQKPVVGPIANPNASPNIFLGTLDDTNNFTSQTILQDSNGNTFGAYHLIVHSGDEIAVTYGINATGVAPVSIGFQFFCDGAWLTTPGTYANYMSGVNSSAGVNTATPWAFVANFGAVVGRDNAMILPPTSTAVGLASGEGILTVAASAAVIVGTFWCVDRTIGAGYTSTGWYASGGGVGIPTGLRLTFGVGILTPGSTSYISVWGIPNS